MANKKKLYVKLHIIKNNYIKYMLLNNFANYLKSFLKYFLFLSIITMEEQIETTYITITLTYLHLLPQDEQSNELNKILAYFKKKQLKYNKCIDYSPEY